jgi:hypothetical protein
MNFNNKLSFNEDLVNLECNNTLWVRDGYSQVYQGIKFLKIHKSIMRLMAKGLIVLETYK